MSFSAPSTIHQKRAFAYQKYPEPKPDAGPGLVPVAVIAEASKKKFKTLGLLDPGEINYSSGVGMKKTLVAIYPRNDLSHSAKSLAMALASHHPNVWPSVDRLMHMTGIRSTRTAYKYLHELRDKGFLTWKPSLRNGLRVNSYRCNWL